MREMIKWEFHKIFIKKRFILIVLIFTMFFAYIQQNSFNSLDSMTKNEQEVYEKYMREISGKITEDKIEKINEDKSEINYVEQNILKVIDDYRRKKVDKATYQNIVKRNRALLSQQKAFQYIERNINYVQEDNDKRYILDERGWKKLLVNEYDYLIFICILIFVIFLCFNSESKNMNEIINTTLRGRKSLLVSKYIVFFLFITFFILTFEIIKFFIFTNYFSITGFDFPLQSISYFFDSYWNISILGCYFICIFLKWLGFLFLGIISIFLTLKSKKLISILVCSLIIVFLPLGILENTKVLWFLSYIGLAHPYRYFAGDFYNEQNIVVSKSFSTLEVLLVVIITIIIASYLIRYTLASRNKNKKRIFIYILFLVLLTGCQSNDLYEKENTYNLSQENFITENEEYFFVNEGIDYIFKNKESLDKFSIIENLEIGNTDFMISFVFIGNDSFYYLKVYNNMKNFDIIQVNSKTFKRNMIYSKEVVSNNNGFLNFMPKIKAERRQDYWAPSSFFITGKYLVLEYTDKIEIIDLHTENIVETLEDYFGPYQISAIGEKIVYVNYQNELTMYDIEKKSKRIILSTLVENFLIYNDSIYFLNLENGNKLYRINKNSNTPKLLFDYEVIDFTIDNEFIYVIKKDDLLPYKINLKNNSFELLNKIKSLNIKKSPFNNQIFLKKLDDFKITSCSLDLCENLMK